jgi:hypothetical protein
MFEVALKCLGASQDGFILTPAGRDTLELALSNVAPDDLKPAINALALLAYVLHTNGSDAASKAILSLTEAVLSRPPAARKSGDLYGT